MSQDKQQTGSPARDDAAAQLLEAAAARKCWSCGCLHNTLSAIEGALPADQRSPELDAAMQAGRERLVPVRYDCLGCEVCYPALAVNALNKGGDGEPLDIPACPTEKPEERQGWPPFPGAYTVLRYHAPVAVCTLTDDRLAEEVTREAGSEVAIIGTLQTENLGIERLLLNVLANPNIRFLVVCGSDSRQAIGHLPGQSLVALSQSGLDDRARITGAKGKRPVLKNVSQEAVEHFRRSVEVIDLVGNTEASLILNAVNECAGRNPGPSEPFAPHTIVAPIPGYLPQRMVPDPEGYFVVYVDRRRNLLSLEHYSKDGVLSTVIEGDSAAKVYIPAIEKGLVSRLDHAAYLGKELARAELALRSGELYVQDRAPEDRGLPVSAGCGCGPICEGGQQ